MTPSSTPAFIIAGTHSGVGKTTVSLAVMGGLAKQGLLVQPFKIGPDFIDAGYHHHATGRGSVNLDLWMMGWAEIAASLARYAAGSDVAVIEAMGALHDGADGTRRGSAADFAHHLGLPVVLVIDVWGMTRSTGAVLRGYEEFDREVEIAAIVLNRVGSPRHYEMVREALPEDIKRRVVGYLPADEGLTVPERHLGLVTVEENVTAAALAAELASHATKTLDLERLTRLVKTARPLRDAAPVQPAAPEDPPAKPSSPVRIGLARDASFCFYYRDNLRRLHAEGAELVPFSPMGDSRLPTGLDGLYFGGGYPESFAAELAANQGLCEDVRRFAAKGLPIYGECGGMMYLGTGLVDFDGKRYPMSGVLPVEVAMDRKHLAIRYVDVETTRDSLLGPVGTKARGQEFHQSRIVSADLEADCFSVRDSTGAPSTAGFAAGGTLGSYIHLHFASNPGIPRWFVGRCRQGQPAGGGGEPVPPQ